MAKAKIASQHSTSTRSNVTRGSTRTATSLPVVKVIWYGTNAAPDSSLSASVTSKTYGVLASSKTFGWYTSESLPPLVLTVPGTAAPLEDRYKRTEVVFSVWPSIPPPFGNDRSAKTATSRSTLVAPSIGTVPVMLGRVGPSTSSTSVTSSAESLGRFTWALNSSVSDPSSTVTSYVLATAAAAPTSAKMS